MTVDSPSISQFSLPNTEEQVIVDRIYSAVMGQRLAPGTKLNEAQLCEAFAAGRMRVRRALLLLASQGIVDLQSNRGAFIARPEPDEARDIFETRILVESRLISRLALSVSKRDIAFLRTHLELEASARASSARIDLIRLSGEFHVKLAVASGSKVMTRFIRELVTRSSLILGIFGNAEYSSCPDDEHAEILTAIEAGDSRQAERVVHRHLAHVQSALDLTRPPVTRTSELSTLLGMS